METAQTIAQAGKQFNLFTRENLPPVLFTTQTIERDGFSINYTDKIESEKMQLPDDILLKFSPTLLFEVRQQTDIRGNVELFYPEHTYTAFLTTRGNIAILRYDSRSKKHFFMPHYAYYREVQNVSFERRERAKKESGLTEPNYIGKFTEKKVFDWLNYCDSEIALNEQIVLAAKDKNAQIEAEIQEYIKKSGGRVTKWGENTEVTNDCFRVIFTHNKKEQWMSKKIEFNGTLEDILAIVNKN